MTKSQQAAADMLAMIDKQKQPFDCMTLSGGGAKGPAYSGVHKALVTSNIMKGLKILAGSSAGAITAAIMATGISPEEMQKISTNTSFLSLLGTEGISMGPILLGKDGKPLQEFISNIIKANISNFFRDKDIGRLCQERINKIDELLANPQLPPEERVSLKAQIIDITSIVDKLTTIKEKCTQKEGEVTFGDLALLRLLAPETFKDLIVTAVDKETGELTIFSSLNTNAHHVSIAAACRASASIPLVFQPAVIDGREYVDGGYRDNIPTAYFPQDQVGTDHDIKEITNPTELRKAKKQGRTLVLAFGSNMDASANIAIWSGKNFNSLSTLIQFLVYIVTKLAGIGGTFQFTETELETASSLREEHAFNTVVLNTQGVGTLSFNEATYLSHYLCTKGYFQVLEYLSNHGLYSGNDAFEYQNFFLKVYENYDNKNLNAPQSGQSKNEMVNTTWQDKNDIKNHNDKARALLSFCNIEIERSVGQEPEVLKLYVALAGKGRNNEVRSDTKAIEALMKALNEPTTPDKIKRGFMTLLGIKQVQNEELSKGGAAAQNLAKFKFTKEDFNRFIDSNKSELLRYNLRKQSQTTGVSP